MKKPITIKINNTNLGYLMIPKCGSTSVLSLLIELKGVDRETSPANLWEADKKNVPNRMSYIKKISTKEKSDILFTVVRDPVERVISAYTNRVLHCQRETFKSFDNFIEVLPNFSTKDLRYHLTPMTEFLGNCPSRFNKIVFVNEINNKLLPFLSSLANKNLLPVHRQVGGSDLKDTIHPTKQQIKKIKEIYKKDYSFLEKIK